MNKLYFTKAEGIYDRLDGILKEFLRRVAQKFF